MKLDSTTFYEVGTVNGVVSALYSSSDLILLKTHQMIPPTIIGCCPNLGLDPKAIGQRDWTLQVRTKFVPYVKWLEDCIVLLI